MDSQDDIATGEYRFLPRSVFVNWTRQFSLVFSLISLVPGAAYAQASSKPPSVDVASIRANRTGAIGSSISRSGGKITLEHVSLKDCIAFAYSIPAGRDYELSGPGWLEVEKFDIAAIFPQDSSGARVREMLKTMLAERFALRTHYESRTTTAYALLVGKGGPKLGAESNGKEGAFIWGEGQLTARAISMEGLSERLSGAVFKLGKPVVDMTGIKGRYDFILKWAPDDLSADGNSNPSIFTALQEQLGLRLSPRKLPFSILVVDHADKVPTEN